ncbi:MAG TPA: ABC transporter ATP-binding protein [Candidatus Gallacutalibacter pullistercoris]|nr:ABC transporter ATP-binding protein [Candidatus Gallacutalibacter pullistercoris]
MEHICKEYTQGDTIIHALRDVDLTIESGEFLSITGQSGSGKSTLMNILGCLDVPTSGIYRIGGKEVNFMPPAALAAFRSRTIGFIFQNFCLIPDLDALENVELPLRYQGIPKRERHRMAEEALERVGLSHRLHHRPSQMSGGQQQRTAIARAIAARPSVILADEPTGNLDRASGEGIMSILQELHQEGKSVVLITHDNKIAKTAERHLDIRDGIVN